MSKTREIRRFQIFAADDLDWISDAVLGVAGPLPSAPVLPTIELPQGWLGRETTPDGLAELGREVEAAVADLTGPARDSWTAITRRLAGDDLANRPMSGTRYVACDLHPGRLGRTPASMEVWEYLEPYVTLDDEVEATRGAMLQDGADATAMVTKTPAGSIGKVEYRLRTEAVDLWGEVRFLRRGGLAYQLFSTADWDGRDVARSILADAVSSMATAEPLRQ